MTPRFVVAFLSLTVLLGSMAALAAGPSGSQVGTLASEDSASQNPASPDDDRLPPPTPPKLKHPGSSTDTGDTTGTSTGDGGTTKPKPPVVKKPDDSGDTPVKKPTTKKKKKKKKKAGVEDTEFPYGLGVKVGLMPYAAMSATTKDHGDRTYDMSMSYGLGLDGHYRLASSFYLTAELMYWWTEINSVEGSTKYDGTGDAMMDLGIGVKYVFLGSEKSSDRVYGRGYLGYSYYISSDGNKITYDDTGTAGKPETLDGNRGGLYYGGAAGIWHRMAKSISLFAEGGLMFHSFTNTGGQEKDALFWDIQATAGFMYHWK